MLKQEESCYKIHDYFQNQDSEGNSTTPTTPTTLSTPIISIDVDARQQIAQWCMDIMKLCNYSEEFAAITMSCLDRFVVSTTTTTTTTTTIDDRRQEEVVVLFDEAQYQLAALTSLYITAKIHCPLALPPDLIVQFSRGMYCVKDIEAMERRMLKAIQWRVNPPTAMDFVRIYLDMIASKKSSNSSTTNSTNGFNQHVQDVIIELSGYQASLSVLQFDIAIEKASHVAVASLLNALNYIYTDDQDFCNSSSIYDFLSEYIDDIDPSCIETLQEELHKSIVEHTTTTTTTTTTSNKELMMTEEEEKHSNAVSVDNKCSKNSSTESPRSVYK